MLIVDTGVIVAAADRDDRHYDEALESLASEAGPLVTTTMVIAEAAYLLDRELGPVAEASLYQSIIDGQLRVEMLGNVDWRRIRELVETYADLRLGGTDASLIAIAERLGATKVATFNHRDFRVVRPTHCDAFELVP